MHHYENRWFKTVKAYIRMDRNERKALGPSQELFGSEFYDSSTLGPGFEAAVLQQLRPLEHFRACPVVLVGCSGHGKSRLIDAVAVALGHTAVCARGATRGTRRHKLGAWGPNEEVVFVDSKGRGALKRLELDGASWKLNETH